MEQLQAALAAVERQRRGARHAQPEDARQADKVAKAALDAEASKAASSAQCRLDAIAAEKERKADEEQRALQRRQEAEKAFADLRTQASLRADARNANAPEALAQSRKTHREKLRSLKSDLKKCTTLVRKVQLGITADDEAKLLNDIKALNLTRYVSELVDAVSETRKTKAVSYTHLTLPTILLV